jgi:putative peptidoglycan lipid II flippase
MSKKLARSTIVFSLVTLLSRLTGFARDVFFAQLFGSTVAFDAFVVAYRIPNFFRRIFAEGAFSQAFVPVLAQHHEQHGYGATKAFISRISGALTLMLLTMVLLAELFSPFLVLFFAPGFLDNPAKYYLTAKLLRIVFPYLLFVSITAFLSAILNTFGRFAVPACTAIIFNLTLLIFMFGFVHYFNPPVMAVAVGVFIGGILQVLVQWPSLKKLNLLPRMQFNFKDEAVRRVLKLMLPALFGVSMTQIGVFLDNFLHLFYPAAVSHGYIIPIGSQGYLLGWQGSRLQRLFYLSSHGSMLENRLSIFLKRWTGQSNVLL